MTEPVNEPELISAARRGDFDAVRRLLEGGADPRARSSDGWTALHFAALAGETDVVARLLAHGADPDAQAWKTEASFGAPLHFAAANGRVGVVRLLIQHGANVNLHDEVGQPPLTIAMQRLKRKQKPAETAEIVRLLEQAGARERAVQGCT